MKVFTQYIAMLCGLIIAYVEEESERESLYFEIVMTRDRPSFHLLFDLISKSEL